MNMELNKIYNEDCFVTMNRIINDNSIDCVLTSPPYNMTKRRGGISDSGRYDIYNDWLSQDEYISFSVKLFKELDRIVKHNGVVIYNLSYSKENGILPYLVISEIYHQTKWTVVDTLIWEKNSAIPSPADKRHYTRKCETIFIFARKTEKETFNRYPEVSSIGSNGQTYYHTYNNIIRARNNDASTHKLNQATYSTDLCIQLLSLYAKPEDVIYDPFMGTGTTGNACKLIGLNYIGSEISQPQCEYAEKRIKEAQQLTLF